MPHGRCSNVASKAPSSLKVGRATCGGEARSGRSLHCVTVSRWRSCWAEQPQIPRQRQVAVGSSYKTTAEQPTARLSPPRILTSLDVICQRLSRFVMIVFHSKLCPGGWRHVTSCGGPRGLSVEPNPQKSTTSLTTVSLPLFPPLLSMPVSFLFNLRAL